MNSVNLYYEQAYDNFLQESLFDTTKKMGLVTFAVDCLNPKASRDKKCAAVLILDSFLQKHKSTHSNTDLVSLITTSTEAVTTLINMLGWTVTEDADIRLFAAKVTTHLAPYLHIIGIPGSMQKVSSLLDAHDEQMTHEDLAHTVDNNGGNADAQQISNRAISPMVNGDGRGIVVRQQIRNDSSNSPLDIEGGNTRAVRCCCLVYKLFLSLMEGKRRFRRHLQDLRSIPHKDLKEKVSLSALGMQILEGLAHDLHNCEEISRATDLLPKIIGFISCSASSMVAEQEEITTSSLKLVEKLASVKGKIGTTLRQDLSDDPFLIGNLAEILELEGSSSYLNQSKLAMNIIAKISIDEKARQNTGTIQAIIDRLVQEFIGGEELSNPLRAEAGQALAMLAIESPNNCSAMLYKTSELIGDLANKLQRGVHVLGRIKDGEGKQMEALIGLASQICSVMSEHIAPVLDTFADDEAFVKKLVGELNARKKPSPDEFPETRGLLVELTISIVEFCPRYAPIFKEHGMMEALSKVVRYTGEVSEEARALRAIVATAKRLIGVDMP
ncbi:hypothetical protein ACQJBY_067174 [Aegilops geniculata]